MALTAAQKAEIERKAVLDEPLSNSKNKEAVEYYREVQANLTYKQGEPVTVFNPAPSSSGGGSGGGGSSNGGGGSASVVVTVGTVDSGKADRQKQMDNFKGWDNNPDVRDLQIRSWHIYVDTGEWNTSEQIQLYKEAERIRLYNNPMYPGSPNGPANPWDADAIYPRGTTPGSDLIEGGLDSAIDPSKWGGYLKAGIGVFFLFMMMSMFRRG